MASVAQPTVLDAAAPIGGAGGTDRLVVTVVIPAYNAALRIGALLEALAAQEIEAGSFEVVVVDNASTDQTREAALAHPAAAALVRRGMNIRVIRESRVGANHARLRGLVEARTEIVCFLDDDNIPDAHFVAQGLLAFRRQAVGLLTSRIYPEYEAEPPFSVLRRQHLLAINCELGDRTISWGAAATLAPTIGAGMWVRRQTLLGAIASEGRSTLLDGRAGGALTCGEDIEMGYLVGRAGFDRIYCPQLKLKHMIPRSRLRAGYICRLIVGIRRSELTLEAKYGQGPGVRTGLVSLARLAGAVLAAPYLLCRRDGFREALFVLADRWARVLGPIPLPDAAPAGNLKANANHGA